MPDDQSRTHSPRTLILRNSGYVLHTTRRSSRGTPLTSAPLHQSNTCADGSYQGASNTYRTAALSKGFGRRQAYESLTCRNPRVARDDQWGYRISAGLHGRSRATRRPLKRGFGWHGTLCRLLLAAGLGFGMTARQGSIGIRRASPRPPMHKRCGSVRDQVVPGHARTVPVVAIVDGGARGCCQRSNVSMMIMCPPQQGHGGR